jgi:phage gpG-like protein
MSNSCRCYLQPDVIQECQDDHRDERQLAAVMANPSKKREFVITTHFFGFDKLTKVFRSAPHWLGEEITKGMRQSALAVQRESAILAPVDTGRLRGSITTEIDKAVIPQWAKVGPAVKYGKYVEFGRKPGRMPPPSALIPWMKRHGIPASAAFLVARAIAKRGIKPKPYMHEGYKMALRTINGIWGRTARAIELRWGRENG